MRILHYLRGARIVAAWIQTGAPTAPIDLVVLRSSTCLRCPMNQKTRAGGFLNWLIQTLISVRTRWRMPLYCHDRLHTCTACMCPLRIKIRVPIETVAQGIDFPAGELTKFWGECWIRREIIK